MKNGTRTSDSGGLVARLASRRLAPVVGNSNIS